MASVGATSGVGAAVAIGVREVNPTADRTVRALPENRIAISPQNSFADPALFTAEFVAQRPPP